MKRNDVATYWKNGIPTYLTDATKGAKANSIVVSGKDVFVAGTEWKSTQNFNDIAKYWKNGTAVDITDGTIPSCANSIAVIEDRIFIAGSQFSHITSMGKYWGYHSSYLPIDETLANGEAFSIYLSIK